MTIKINCSCFVISVVIYFFLIFCENHSFLIIVKENTSYSSLSKKICIGGIILPKLLKHISNNNIAYKRIIKAAFPLSLAILFLLHADNNPTKSSLKYLIPGISSGISLSLAYYSNQNRREIFLTNHLYELIALQTFAFFCLFDFIFRVKIHVKALPYNYYRVCSPIEIQEQLSRLKIFNRNNNNKEKIIQILNQIKFIRLHK